MPSQTSQAIELQVSKFQYKQTELPQSKDIFMPLYGWINMITENDVSFGARSGMTHVIKTRADELSNKHLLRTIEIKTSRSIAAHILI